MKVWKLCIALIKKYGINYNITIDDFLKLHEDKQNREMFERANAHVAKQIYDRSTEIGKVDRATKSWRDRTMQELLTEFKNSMEPTQEILNDLKSKLDPAKPTSAIMEVDGPSKFIDSAGVTKSITIQDVKNVDGAAALVNKMLENKQS